MTAGKKKAGEVECLEASHYVGLLVNQPLPVAGCPSTSHPNNFYRHSMNRRAGKQGNCQLKDISTHA